MGWDIHVPRLAALGYPINFSSKSGPTTRLAPNFNGISQYGNVGKIVLEGSFDIEVTVRLNETSTEQWIYGDWISGSQSVAIRVSSGQLQFFISPNGTILESVSTPITTGTSTIKCGLISGVDIYASVNDNVARQATARANVLNSNHDVLIGRKNAAGFYFNGNIYNLKVNDGSVYNYTMDDGWANNPTMRNTGSGADGTFVNMTEAAWQEITL